MKTLIEHCLLIDGAGTAPVHDAWIWLDGDRIGAIGRHDENTTGQAVPVADVSVNAAGRAVLPGLINLHVHIQRRHLHCWNAQTAFRHGAPQIENQPDTLRMLWAVKNAWHELLHGVTTLRDCGSKNRINVALREAIASGLVDGPRVIACGFGIASTGGHETHRYQGAVEADGPSQVRKAVRAEIKAGADFIKLMAGGGLGGMPEHEDPRWAELTVEELTAGVEAAHSRGKRVTVHAIGIVPIINSLRAGVDCIEHGAMLNREAVELMAERGVYYVPTASGIANVARRERETGSPVLAQVIEDVVVTPLRASIRMAYEAGIPIGCGTDTLGEMVEELQWLHACGLPAAACLRAATSVAARILGMDGVVGTLQVGKIADLFIVEGNPLQDLDSLRRIWTVIKSGAVVDYQRLCGFEDCEYSIRG